VIEQVIGYVTVTDEMLADGRPFREGLAVMMTGTKPTHRFRKVWAEGYHAALEDIRAGRLELVGGEFRAVLP
jgi:hypothetical protein